MQVFGLPGHLSAPPGRRRVFSQRRPRISKREKTRRRGALAHGARSRTDGGGCRSSGGRVPFHAPSLAQAGRAAQPASPPGAGPEPPRGRSGGGRAPQARLSDVGQGQDRAAGARARLCGQRRHGRADPGRPHQARARARRARPLAQARAALGREKAALRRAQARDCRVPEARRCRADRHALHSILPGQAIKQFTAYDPFAKWTVARPYKRATAKNTAEFLDRVRAQMPDPVRAIQIDGGSEFMAEFEKACADAKIPLYLLPPRSPKLNGAVERCNGAWRYEFYACSDLPLDINKIAERVDAFQNLYNNHRPHGALAGMTPAKYLSIRRASQTPPSHMS